MFRMRITAFFLAIIIGMSSLGLCLSLFQGHSLEKGSMAMMQMEKDTCHEAVGTCAASLVSGDHAGHHTIIPATVPHHVDASVIPVFAFLAASFFLYLQRRDSADTNALIKSLLQRFLNPVLQWSALSSLVSCFRSGILHPKRYASA